MTYMELRKHVATAHPIRPKCGECGEIFQSKVLLTKHKKNHLAERPIYACDQCEKTFSTNSNLVTHKRVIHEGLRPFVCEVDGCNETFGYKNCYERHMRNVHGKRDVDRDAPRPKRAKTLEIDQILTIGAST